jgi:hypothetical protein
MKALLLLGFLYSSFAMAMDKPPAKDDGGDFHVLVNPRIYDPRAFSGDKVKTGALPEPGNSPMAVPSRERREALFQQVPGLEAALGRAHADELTRDVLYLRAGTKSLKDLKKTYPYLNEKQLARLQKLRKNFRTEAPQKNR